VTWKDEKQALITLDGKRFGEAMGEYLTKVAPLFAAAKGAAYLTNTKDGGRLTRAAILIAAAQVKLAVTNPTKAGIGAAEATWVNSPKWEKFKADVQLHGAFAGSGSRGAAQKWNMLGNVGKYAGVAYVGRHAIALGIPKNIKVRQSPFGRSKKMIAVAKYAKYLEFGTSKKPDAMPLFRSVMHVFMKTTYTELQKAPEKTMKKIKKLRAKRKIMQAKDAKELEADMKKLETAFSNEAKQIEKQLTSGASEAHLLGDSGAGLTASSDVRGQAQISNLTALDISAEKTAKKEMHDVLSAAKLDAAAKAEIEKLLNTGNYTRIVEQGGTKTAQVYDENDLQDLTGEFD